MRALSQYETQTWECFVATLLAPEVFRFTAARLMGHGSQFSSRSPPTVLDSYTYSR
jgi:hypothetical protein